VSSQCYSKDIMILILSTPRTGSTWFTNHIAQKYNLENLNEYFSDNGNTKLDFDTQLNRLEYVKSNKNVVIKCFPWHLTTNTGIAPARFSFLQKNLLRLADRIYILIRNDFNSQCRSFYIASVSGHWGPQPQQHQLLTLDLDLYNKVVTHLQEGYQLLSEYKTITNCEIVEYESLPFLTDQRYAKSVVWDKEPSDVVFDVRSLFYH